MGGEAACGQKGGCHVQSNEMVAELVGVLAVVVEDTGGGGVGGGAKTRGEVNEVCAMGKGHFVEPVVVVVGDVAAPLAGLFVRFGSAIAEYVPVSGDADNSARDTAAQVPKAAVDTGDAVADQPVWCGVPTGDFAGCGQAQQVVGSDSDQDCLGAAEVPAHSCGVLDFPPQGPRRPPIDGHVGDFYGVVGGLFGEVANQLRVGVVSRTSAAGDGVTERDDSLQGHVCSFCQRVVGA